MNEGDAGNSADDVDDDEGDAEVDDVLPVRWARGARVGDEVFATEGRGRSFSGCRRLAFSECAKLSEYVRGDDGGLTEAVGTADNMDPAEVLCGDSRLTRSAAALCTVFISRGPVALARGTGFK